MTLFVVGTTVTPLAGADSTKARNSALAPPDTVLLAPLPSSAVDPAGKKLLTRRPTHVAKQAPIDRGLISELAGNGIPRTALNAYRVAAARLANAESGCGIPWYLLAGIGREESDHGRVGGAVLHADGVSTPPIIGPALDGKHYDFIPAPSNGLSLDGDVKYAHALGPMQFIPSTWAGYGADATGDGKADIFNINDAALGAARYLCAAGGNLRGHAGQARAVLAYNHSDQYLAQVLALADAYRRGISITGVPVGITTGKLPTLRHTGALPPANPGAPTAVAAQKAPGKTSPAAARTAPPSKKPLGTGSTRPTRTPSSSDPQNPPASSSPSPSRPAPSSPAPADPSTSAAIPSPCPSLLDGVVPCPSPT